MKNLILLFYLALAAASCASTRQLGSSSSSRVEVRTETVTTTDTVYVELPVIEQSVRTLDTLSVLENRFARSEASVSAGVLSHSLETKPVKQPVKVENKIVYRDSLVYVDRTVTVPEYIEKPLSSWQRFRLSLGNVALVAIALLLIFGISKLFHSIH